MRRLRRVHLSDLRPPRCHAVSCLSGEARSAGRADQTGRVKHGNRNTPGSDRNGRAVLRNRAHADRADARRAAYRESDDLAAARRSSRRRDRRRRRLGLRHRRRRLRRLDARRLSRSRAAGECATESPAVARVARLRHDDRGRRFADRFRCARFSRRTNPSNRARRSRDVVSSSAFRPTRRRSRKRRRSSSARRAICGAA